MTPEMIFPSVDLPAPFSPTSACTVPGLIVSDTSLRAGTPPYRFDTWLTTKSSLCSQRYCGVPLLGFLSTCQFNIPMSVSDVRSLSY